MQKLLDVGMEVRQNAENIRRWGRSWFEGRDC
jgi:hypothetical protein